MPAAPSGARRRVLHAGQSTGIGMAGIMGHGAGRSTARPPPDHGAAVPIRTIARSGTRISRARARRSSTVTPAKSASMVVDQS